jgi:hypothetical protein
MSVVQSCFIWICSHKTKTVLNLITLWLSQRFSTTVVLCLGDDIVDMGCNAIVSENPTYDTCQCDAELSCPANNKERLKYLCSTCRGGFSMWKCHCRAQAVTCHCATNDDSHSLALNLALMQNWVLQSRQHHSMLCGCAFTVKLYILHSTDTKLPTSNKSYFLLFSVQIPSRVTTGTLL